MLKKPCAIVAVWACTASIPSNMHFDTSTHSYLFSNASALPYLSQELPFKHTQQTVMYEIIHTLYTIKFSFE